MQSRVVEIDDLGPVRRRTGDEDEERNTGPRDYPERDPLDLIEEDKRPFARRKLVSTCCGGFRTVYDEVTAQTLHPALFPIQILTYLFYPGLIMLFALVMWTEKGMRMEACTAVAIIAFVVGAVLQNISYMFKRQEMAQQVVKDAQAKGPNRKLNLQISPSSIPQDDDSDDKFFSKKTFFFLVPPKTSIAELVTVIMLAPVYGFFATYLCHPATAEETYPGDEDQ